MIKLKYSILISLIATSAIAQTNIDSLFNVAINHSKAKEYQLAIDNAKQVIQLDSSRNDVRVFIANVYAWQNDFEQSKKYIQEVYATEPKNKELYNTWLNVLLWNNEYQTLLTTIDTAITNGYQDNYNITLKKALAYKGLQNYSAGVNYLNQNKSFLDSTDINYLYSELRRSANKNTISAFYSINLFESSNPAPQHWAYFDYSTNIAQTIFILRCNYLNKFNMEDIQPEVDMYHNFSNAHYLYGNYGFGIKNNLFPRHRLGIEYFFPFGHNFEASGGARLLTYTNDNVLVLTGHLGKYISNLWLSIRPYYTIKDGGNTFTSLINLRIYDQNPINYWGMELSYGYSPDDRYSSTQSIRTSLNAYSVKMERNIALSLSNEIKLGAGYAYEETVPDSFRNRFLFEVLLKHRF